jgi:serine/threonine protein phosphatase PrpC
VDSIQHSFSVHPEIQAASALKIAEDKLLEHLQEHPEASGMASTLTLASIREDGVYVAWVGDSRIYQFRNGHILFQSRDHSWVNEALDAGIITVEEAINHPKSNVITRAVQGAHKPAAPQDALLTDIKKGDFFLLCSDGVLESWNNEELSELFASGLDCDALSRELASKCAGFSRDNYTAIVFQVESASVLVKEEIPVVDAIPVYGREAEPAHNRETTSISPSGKKKSPALIFLLLALAAFAMFYFSPTGKKEETSVTKNPPHNPAPEPTQKPNDPMKARKPTTTTKPNPKSTQTQSEPIENPEPTQTPAEEKNNPNLTKTTSGSIEKESTQTPADQKKASKPKQSTADSDNKVKEPKQMNSDAKKATKPSQTNAEPEKAAAPTKTAAEEKKKAKPTQTPSEPKEAIQPKPSEKESNP